MLKDTWTDLENAVSGIEDSGSDLTVEPINEIAHAVIDLEKNGGSSPAAFDTEMSDISENAVQNKVVKAYVDETKSSLQKYIDEQILGGAW